MSSKDGQNSASYSADTVEPREQFTSKRIFPARAFNFIESLLRGAAKDRIQLEIQIHVFLIFIQLVLIHRSWADVTYGGFDGGYWYFSTVAQVIGALSALVIASYSVSITGSKRNLADLRMASQDYEVTYEKIGEAIRMDQKQQRTSFSWVSIVGLIVLAVNLFAIFRLDIVYDSPGLYLVTAFSIVHYMVALAIRVPPMLLPTAHHLAGKKIAQTLNEIAEGEDKRESPRQDTVDPEAYDSKKRATKEETAAKHPVV